MAEVSPVLVKRFWAKVQKSSTCWLWTAGTYRFGYGAFAIKAASDRKAIGVTMIAAHRMAWILTYGSIPDGLCVLHDCPGGDNPECVRPSHMFLGTKGDNVRDCVRKGRHFFAIKTKCIRGHEFTPENTKVRPTGRGGMGRWCRECDRMYKRESA